MTYTATRTAKGLSVTFPDGTTQTFNGKRALAAVAIVVGTWTDGIDRSSWGGTIYNTTLHGTIAAAMKERNARASDPQTDVRIVEVTE